MEKDKIIVLAKKENAKEETRGYLLYNIGNPTPFIVCSYYKEEGNKVSWYWGYYFDNLQDALKFFYQDKIQKGLNNMRKNINTIIDGNINKFTKEDLTEDEKINTYDIKSKIRFCEYELADDLQEYFIKKFGLKL